MVRKRILEPLCLHVPLPPSVALMCWVTPSVGVGGDAVGALCRSGAYNGANDR